MGQVVFRLFNEEEDAAFLCRRNCKLDLDSVLLSFADKRQRYVVEMGKHSSLPARARSHVERNGKDFFSNRSGLFFQLRIDRLDAGVAKKCVAQMSV